MPLGVVPLTLQKHACFFLVDGFVPFLHEITSKPFLSTFPHQGEGVENICPGILNLKEEK
jgi:hypothetical protein